MSRRTRLRCALSAAGLLGALTLAWPLLRGDPVTVPTFESIRAAHKPSDARLLDRHGEVVHAWRVDPTARRLGWTRLSEISPALQTAVLASEDRRFYAHRGVDVRALAGAAIQWIGGGPGRGASTISMQVAALLSPDLRRRGGPRGLLQKWRQTRFAWRLESAWSKAEILEAYLNRVTFRGELQGVAAAADALFGKAPHGVGDAESAVLAALIRAPNADPSAIARRAWAVRESSAGRSDRDEIAAVAASVAGSPVGGRDRPTLAPHVARRLFPAARVPAAPPPTIRTTLDGTLQRVAADALNRHLLVVREGHVRDGAVLVADNATGQVLAYVGSSGALSEARHVDGVKARRQAGSALKPFLYGVALERRLLTPASLLEDTPLELPQTAGLYRPRNYDERFRGLLTARAALAGSVNIPAVRVLALVGPDGFVAQLSRLGFDGLTEPGDFYGPSLALGSADVSLWELVAAYRSLATGGLWSPLQLIPDGGGAAARRVYSEQTAFLLSSILSDRESRSGTFGLENPLATPFWTAVKTGTSKDMRDNWCIGYSARYTVGVWVGNSSGEPMRNVSGITGAAPIWTEIMAWLHRQTPSRLPMPPDGVHARRVTFPHGVEPDREEWFLAGTEPETIHRVPSAPLARIIAPTAGMLVALDPDIPASRQRIVFEAEGVDSSIRWVLNGADMGTATRSLAWQLVPGRHTLSLIDNTARSYDSVTFIVRGAPVPPVESPIAGSTIPH